MSWLLAERAVYNGEISILELVSEKYSLSEIDGCENSGHRDNYALPVLLRKLIYRSHVLYLRVMVLISKSWLLGSLIENSFSMAICFG